MNCPICSAESPDDKLFCGDCGFPLDQRQSSVREQVKTVIREELKDQKALEIETAAAIVTRLSKWAKLFGVFVGIPLGVLAIVLTILGIRTYTGFYEKVEMAKNNSVKTMQDEAKTQIDAIKKEGGNLSATIQTLKTEVEQNRDVLASLGRRIRGIEETVEFRTSVDPELKKRLESTLKRFLDYFTKLGFRTKTDRIIVDVTAAPREPGMISYYEPATDSLTIDKAYADDIDNLLREYAHHVLFSASPLRDVLDYEHTWMFEAVESGLATYFACSFKDSPLSGEITAKKLHLPAASWTIKNSRKVTEIVKNDPSSIMVDGMQVWAGVFWELRESITKAVADKILFDAWIALTPEDVKTNDAVVFMNKLLAADAKVEDGKSADQIRKTFRNRGAKF